MAAALTPAQIAKMNPTQIALYNQQAGIKAPAAPTPFPKPTVKPTTPQIIPKPQPPGSVNIIPKPTPSFGTPAAVTGGNAPVNTGTPTPVNSAAVITGTAQPQSPPPPASSSAPSMGGNAPVQQGSGTPPMSTPFPATPVPAGPVQAYPAGMDAGSIVSDFMTNLLDEDGQYIQNARRRGLETAQNRGLRNSSIAAGASQRAALEAAQPLVSEMVGIQQDRENRAFTGEQNQLDRNQQITMSQVQNWLNNETFNREFNGALSMLPITSAANLMSTIQQYALENPEVYTPDVINGFANFFQNNFATMLQDYFPQYYGGGT